ncbi:MAG: tetratricopeptide repeat protein [Pirellulales bacterium]
MSKQLNERLALVDRAWELRRNGENSAAIALFDELLSKYPFPDLFNERGLAYTDLGDRETALSDFTKGLALDPNDAELLSNRGNTYLRLGRYSHAIRDYDAALSASNERVVTAHAYNGRGWAKWQLGQPSAAITDFEAAIRADDVNASPLHNLAIVLASLEREIESLTCLDQALRILPDGVSTLCLRSDVHRRLHHFPQALDDCMRAHRADNSDPRPRWRIAWLRSTCGDPAIRDGEEALTHALAACEATHFEDVSCLASLAAAYGECRRFSEAVRWQEKAVALARSTDQEWATDCLRTLMCDQPLRFGHTSQEVDELCDAMDELLLVLPEIVRKTSSGEQCKNKRG